jgi:hypothetical protein
MKIAKRKERTLLKFYGTCLVVTMLPYAESPAVDPHKKVPPVEQKNDLISFAESCLKEYEENLLEKKNKKEKKTKKFEATIRKAKQDKSEKWKHNTHLEKLKSKVKKLVKELKDSSKPEEKAKAQETLNKIFQKKDMPKDVRKDLEKIVDESKWFGGVRRWISGTSEPSVPLSKKEQRLSWVQKLIKNLREGETENPVSILEEAFKEKKKKKISLSKQLENALQKTVDSPDQEHLQEMIQLFEKYLENVKKSQEVEKKNSEKPKKALRFFENDNAVDALHKHTQTAQAKQMKKIEKRVNLLEEKINKIKDPEKKKKVFRALASKLPLNADQKKKLEASLQKGSWTSPQFLRSALGLLVSGSFTIAGTIAGSVLGAKIGNAVTGNEAVQGLGGTMGSMIFTGYGSKLGTTVGNKIASWIGPKNESAECKMLRESRQKIVENVLQPYWDSRNDVAMSLYHFPKNISVKFDHEKSAAEKLCRRANTLENKQKCAKKLSKLAENGKLIVQETTKQQAAWGKQMKVVENSYNKALDRLKQEETALETLMKSCKEA